MASARVYRGKGRVSCTRPIIIGIAVSIAVTLILICATSLIFSMIECIAKNAVAPLSVAAAAIGCFVGGYICASTIGKNGLVFGAVIGATLFFIILIIGCFESNFKFGIAAFAKFMIMIISGCCGGHLGTNGRYCRK